MNGATEAGRGVAVVVRVYVRVCLPPLIWRWRTYLARKLPGPDGPDRFDETDAEPAPDDDDAEGARAAQLYVDPRCGIVVYNPKPLVEQLFGNSDWVRVRVYHGVRVWIRSWIPWGISM